MRRIVLLFAVPLVGSACATILGVDVPLPGADAGVLAVCPDIAQFVDAGAGASASAKCFSFIDPDLMAIIANLRFSGIEVVALMPRPQLSYEPQGRRASLDDAGDHAWSYREVEPNGPFTVATIVSLDPPPAPVTIDILQASEFTQGSKEGAVDSLRAAFDGNAWTVSFVASTDFADGGSVGTTTVLATGVASNVPLRVGIVVDRLAEGGIQSQAVLSKEGSVLTTSAVVTHSVVGTRWQGLVGVSRVSGGPNVSVLDRAYFSTR
jgi:hypothetical protein